MSGASAAAPDVDVEAVMAENARLRQRLEELQEIVDAQPPPAAAEANGAPSAARRRRRGDRTATAAAAAVGVGPRAAASEAILRGQLAQLRRQVKLQWCAVDASSAVTQEVSRSTRGRPRRRDRPQFSATARGTRRGCTYHVFSLGLFRYDGGGASSAAERRRHRVEGVRTV